MEEEKVVPESSKDNIESPPAGDSNVGIVEKSGTLAEDPDYIRIKEEINNKWLKSSGYEEFSFEHQNFLLGDATNPGYKTLDMLVEESFAAEYPKKMQEYKEGERIKVYDSVTEDPAYIELQDEITRRVNNNSAVRQAARSGLGWEEQNRAYNRENFSGIRRFVDQFPEKAQGYAKKWYDFVKKNPEVESMNNAVWQEWCNENPGNDVVDKVRDIAMAVEGGKRRRKIDNLQKPVHAVGGEIARIRGDLDLPEPVNEKTPHTKDLENLSHLINEGVHRAIRQIPEDVLLADKETLEGMQEELKNLPYLSSNKTQELIAYSGEDEGVVMVETSKVVGSVSGAFRNWATEYDSRKGRVVAVAERIIEGTEGSIEHIFHLSNPEDGIKLKRISGPEGDLFIVVDGTHRVAGAKLVQLPELPAQVEKMPDLSETRTTDSQLKGQWENRIERGLIDGKIEETETVDPTTGVKKKTFNLEIKAQVLPWAILSQQSFVDMTKFYLNHYPNALDNIKSLKTGEKIPKEVFLDGIAMNYYLADRWSEYKPKRG